jgi:rubrerythrin
MEAKDSEYAKKVVLDDVESDHKFSELCSNDEKYAKEVYDQMQDELYAEELMRQEKLRVERENEERLSLIMADEKIAREHQHMASKEAEEKDSKMAENDFELAKRIQQTLDNKFLQLQKKQEMEDAKLSRQLSVSMAREAHRQQKSSKWTSSKGFKHFQDTQSIQQAWLDADADVDDVMDGICLTIILPHLRQLNVKVHGKRTVEIEAGRTIFVGEEATAENSQYCAEFLIDGPNVSLKESDVSYEYSHESAMLHLYIEKVHLHGENPVTDKVESETFLGGLKENFRRLFQKSKK